ncbi:MAG: hypothetical protein CM15mP12_5750 [Gammaproteobacteria bacterium]|nr:MAG: hypothetical protein CM15mP12_5750 [Gammaproteobacteria bacterium]
MSFSRFLCFGKTVMPSEVLDDLFNGIFVKNETQFYKEIYNQKNVDLC